LTFELAVLQRKSTDLYLTYYSLSVMRYRIERNAKKQRYAENAKQEKDSALASPSWMFAASRKVVDAAA
jgi:hypothetical protein